MTRSNECKEELLGEGILGYAACEPLDHLALTASLVNVCHNTDMRRIRTV